MNIELNQINSKLAMRLLYQWFYRYKRLSKMDNSTITFIIYHGSKLNLVKKYSDSMQGTVYHRAKYTAYYELNERTLDIIDKNRSESIEITISGMDIKRSINKLKVTDHYFYKILLIYSAPQIIIKSNSRLNKLSGNTIYNHKKKAIKLLYGLLIDILLE